MTKILSRYKLVIFAAVLATVVGAEAGIPRGTASGGAGGRTSAAISIKKVAVIADATMDAPTRHGIGKLEEALSSKRIAVSEDAGQVGGSDFAVLAGLAASGGPAAVALGQMKAPVPRGAEALTIRKGSTYQGKPAILLTGVDGTGLMYAVLDLADRACGTGTSIKKRTIRRLI